MERDVYRFSLPSAIKQRRNCDESGNRFLDEGMMHTPPYDLLAAENYAPSFPYAIGGPTFTDGAVWVERFARAVERGGSAIAVMTP